MSFSSNLYPPGRGLSTIQKFQISSLTKLVRATNSEIRKEHEMEIRIVSQLALFLTNRLALTTAREMEYFQFVRASIISRFLELDDFEKTEDGNEA